MSLFELPMELDQRIEQALASRVCTAQDGSYITRSEGKRKSGRRTRYIVRLATGYSEEPC
jgi:hypothetical protein